MAKTSLVDWKRPSRRSTRWVSQGWRFFKPRPSWAIPCLQQVVFNILTNAIKYAFPDPDLFNVQILPEKAEGGVNLVFRDNGIGIPPGMEETIFLEGVRGPNASDYNAPGDGIGLFIVREILKAHGATIKAGRISDKPYRTEFVIFLPKELTLPDFIKDPALSPNN